MAKAIDRSASRGSVTSATLLEELLRGPRPETGSESRTPSPAAAPSVIVGELLALRDADRVPLVRFSGQDGVGARAARSMIDLHAEHVGSDVALAFEEGDWTKPVVLGVLKSAAGAGAAALGVEADGDRMTVTASEQLVLRCGKASITLTKAGKIVIDGAFVLSRASGVNRVKGGSVQIN